MKEISLRKKRWHNPLPYILVIGMVIGIRIGWQQLISPPVQAQITSTPRAIRNVEKRQAVEITPTPAVPSAVEITPSVKVNPRAWVAEPAPDFSLKTVNGEVVRLSDFRGKPIFINLWASWCPPCRYEMPGIQAAYEKYKERGLVMLGLNFTVQDSLPEVEAFIKEFQLTFPILLDKDGEVSGLYGMRGLPTSYFIDSKGILQRIQFGAMTPEKLDKYLGEILPQ